MNVLHIAAGNMYGGVETIISTLAGYRDLCPAMTMEVALCYDGRLAAQLRALGVKTHLVGTVRFSRPWSIIKARQAIKLIIKEQKIDAVIYHSTWPRGVFGRVAERLNCKSVIWIHNPPTGKHWTERLAGWIAPDLVISVSKDTDSSIKKLFQTVPHQVMYTPLPSNSTQACNTSEKMYAALRTEFSTPQSDVVIVQASRMEEWKGHRNLLRALQRMKDLKGWTCWIAGGAQLPQEKAYVEDVKSMCEKLGLSERVRFLGQRSDVLNVLKAADIYCQANTGPEGFSLAFIEACLVRLPIVTSALGGAMEIVNEDSGVLVPVGDYEGFSKALIRLVQDCRLRESMGNAGYRRVWDMCDPGKQMNALHALLSGIEPRDTIEQSCHIQEVKGN